MPSWWVVCLAPFTVMWMLGEAPLSLRSRRDLDNSIHTSVFPRKISRGWFRRKRIYDTWHRDGSGLGCWGLRGGKREPGLVPFSESGSECEDEVDCEGDSEKLLDQEVESAQ
eukprot:1365252-Amorphochlora_amoeboformis.AAC.1